MKVLSLFSGIGAFEKALDNLQVPYDLVAYCEIDKYASKSYSAIHGVPENMNLGDITKVNEKKLPNGIDLITYGFPCQDISLAGKQKGLFNEDGTQTRSGLFFDALRIIEETQPRVAIAENVKNLTSKKFALQFKIVLDSLKAAGYNNYWKVLNLKDFGIPQNRERVFIVGIRKDIDNGTFSFPEGFPLEKRLKDVMEEEVEEKFYLSETAIAGLIRHKERNAEKGNGFGYQLRNGDEVAPTIRARYYKDGQECLIGAEQPICVSDSKCVQVGQIYGTERKLNPQSGRIYDANGISPTLDACSGGNRMPKVLMEKITAAAMRGRYNEAGCVEQTVEVSDREYANALTTVQKDSMVASAMQGIYEDMVKCNNTLRIRKLTPKECFRLMGFDDADFEKASSVNSNTQLYKQAGNSIGVPVVEHIMTALFQCGALVR